ncbi:MAG: VOC family protein [Ruminococcaceae bacterium]|nr:VOC family protein [Oscillospiraceae bacterium]
MSKIKGVHHICLKPEKELYKKTVDFYMQVLGCPEVRSWGEGENAGCMLSCGDNTVMEILHGDSGVKYGNGPIEHIAFSVDDIAEIVEDVRNAGYQILIEPKEVNIGGNYKVEIAFCLGPLGETIEFFKEL